MDDIFELLTKMYAEFSKEFKDVRGEIKELSRRLTKVEIKLENDVSNKLDVLFEAQGETNKRLDSIEHKLDVLSGRVDRHDLEIKFLKSAR